MMVQQNGDLFIMCCKAFDKYVREKSKIEKFGSELMSAALSMNGTLKLNKQMSTTDRNEQEGIMLLCMGVMRTVRNPKSHEPALEWKVSREDALDILSLLSFLYRQIINVNTNMYTFACLRMYKITRFLSLNDSLIDKNLQR